MSFNPTPFNQPPVPQFEPQDNKPWVPEGILVGTAVVLGVLVLLMAGLTLNEYRGDETQSATPATSENLPPSTLGSQPPTTEAPTPEVEPLPCPEGTAQEICAAAEFVQLQRGKPFKEFPNVELEEPSEFNRKLLEGFEEGRESLERSEITLKAAGIIPEDSDLYNQFRQVLELGVIGSYSPSDKRLAVKGQELTLFVQSTIVHELVHAFDDQWFDLGRSFEDDEESYGFTAIVEGNATRVEDAWTAELSPEQRRTLQEQQRDFLTPEERARYSTIPPGIVQLQLSPYEDGSAYLARAAPEAAQVDALLEAPPKTSERILHPEISEDQDPQVEVPTPEFGGDDRSEGKFGEATLRLMLRSPEAAEGWDGDSYVSWEQDGKACIVIDIVAEDEAQLAEMRNGAEAWAASGDPQRSVTEVETASQKAIRLANCPL